MKRRSARAGQGLSLSCPKLNSTPTSLLFTDLSSWSGHAISIPLENLDRYRHLVNSVGTIREAGRFCDILMAVGAARQKSKELVAIPVESKAEPSPENGPTGYALVELFGHQRIVGFLSQQSFPNGVLWRVDVPDLLKEGKKVRDGFTRYFGLSAIYSITPVSEAVVRQLLPNIDGTPGEARPLSVRSFSRDYEED